MKLVFNRETQTIVAVADDGTVIASYECRDDFWAGENDEGQPRASLPDGDYTASAEQPGQSAAEANGPAYGTFYVKTGDPRGRDIHGGGSGLPDPFAPRQGWTPTLGCLRMQNEDGEDLSRRIIDNGNAIRLEVRTSC